MRYFTKELWVGAQDIQDDDECDRAWDLAHEQYQEQFKAIQDRLNPTVLHFFITASIHDGSLVSVEIRDCSYIISNGEDSSLNLHPVCAYLKIRNCDGSQQWSLKYENVRKSVVDFPSDEPAFFSDGEGFNDIGYHELTDAGAGFLRHELLFSSGASILFEFKHVSISSEPA